MWKTIYINNIDIHTYICIYVCVCMFIYIYTFQRESNIHPLKTDNSVRKIVKYGS